MASKTPPNVVALLESHSYRTFTQLRQINLELAAANAELEEVNRDLLAANAQPLSENILLLGRLLRFVS